MSQNDRELEDVDEEVSPTTPIALLGEEQDVVAAPRRESILQSSKDVFLSCLPLGFITFGGPQAHIAILHDQFVEKRRWVTEQQFTELFALGQSLPGPTSTQLVIAVGTIRGGILGGLIAFFCFSLPAAIILTICGILFSNAEFEKNMPAALVEVQRGLSCVGVALVASASV
jgi:chromate transporter